MKMAALAIVSQCFKVCRAFLLFSLSLSQSQKNRLSLKLKRIISRDGIIMPLNTDIKRTCVKDRAHVTIDLKQISKN